MSNVLFRQGGLADLPEIQRLNQQLFVYEGEEEFHTGTYDSHWPYEKAGADYFSSFLNGSPGKTLVLAEIDGHVIGYLAGSFATRAYRLQNPIGEIDNMFIEANHRHSKVGSELNVRFKDWLVQHGAAYVRVSAFAKNSAAISFYHSLGFDEHEVVLEMPL